MTRASIGIRTVGSSGRCEPDEMMHESSRAPAGSYGTELRTGGAGGLLKIMRLGATEFPPVLFRVFACSLSGVTPSLLDRRCAVLIPRSRRS